MSKNWYAVITADVLYDKDLTPRQKLLVAIVANLSNEKGYCFASNSYLAELNNCSARSIQRDLELLEEKYLKRVVKLKSNNEVEFRALTPMSPMTQMSSPHDTDDTTPHDTDVIYNNKEYNNKDNIKIKEDFETEILKSRYWIESMAKIHRTNIQKVEEYIKIYISMIDIKSIENESQIKFGFNKWMKGEKNKTPSKKSKFNSPVL